MGETGRSRHAPRAEATPTSLIHLDHDEGSCHRCARGRDYSTRTRYRRVKLRASAINRLSSARCTRCRVQKRTDPASPLCATWPQNVEILEGMVHRPRPREPFDRTTRVIELPSIRRTKRPYAHGAGTAAQAGSRRISLRVVAQIGVAKFTRPLPIPEGPADAAGRRSTR